MYAFFILAEVMDIMGKGLLKPQQAMPYHKYVGNVYTFQNRLELYHTFLKKLLVSAIF